MQMRAETKEKPTKSKPIKRLLERKEMIRALASLGRNKYFENEGLETVQKLLQDLTATPEQTVQLRGHCFAHMLSH